MGFGDVKHARTTIHVEADFHGTVVNEDVSWIVSKVHIHYGHYWPPITPAVIFKISPIH
jgi:hypothetical protein